MIGRWAVRPTKDNIMKKFFLIILACFALSLTTVNVNASKYPSSEPQRELNFRSNQILKGSNGFTLEIYTDHTWVLWDNDGVRHSLGIWKLQGKTLVLYYKNGSFLTSGECTLSGGGIGSVYIFGTTFRR